MNIIGRIRRLLGRNKPPSDGWAPSTFSEGYGTTGESIEAGVPVFDRLAEEAEMSREARRCQSRLRQKTGSGGNRSWRCTLHAGHEKGLDTPWPLHNNGAGGRSWA